jgi:hypothetical protein
MSSIKGSDLKTFEVFLPGRVMVIMAYNHADVVKFLQDNDLDCGFGPMDLGERVWDVRSQNYSDPITVLCSSTESGQSFMRKHKQECDARSFEEAGE